MFAWLERRQVALYLGSLAAGAGAGFLVSRTPLPGLRALATSAPAVLIALATVLVPLALDYLLQRGAGAIRTKAENLSERAMVPLMMLVLFTTVAAHFGAVAHQLGQLFPLMITYAVYALVSGLLAWFLAAKTQAADRVALTFSAVTRNALVVLPFVLGLAEIAGQPALPLAVVSQTLVELCVMVGMVKLLRPVTARQNKSGQQAQNREEPSGVA